MSKAVQKRIESSRSVVLAGYVYADVAAEAWKRRQQAFFDLTLAEGSDETPQWLAEMAATDDSASLSLATIFRFVANDIEEAGEAMIARDEHLARRRTEHRLARRRRDALVKPLYNELSKTRKFFRGILRNGPDPDYLDLKGPTPRDPDALVHWACLAISVLADPEKSPECRYGRGGKLETSKFAERLESRCKALRGALKTVHSAAQGEIAALSAQRAAIAAFDGNHKQGARLFEAALEYLGLPSLAATVRPGVKRRGRPLKRSQSDLYPDLVTRVLGENRRQTASDETDDHPWVETFDQSRETPQRKVERGFYKPKKGDQKIEQASRKLSEPLRKIETGLRKLSAAHWKIDNGLRKPPGSRQKIESPPYEPAEREVSPFNAVSWNPGRRYRRRIVHGLDRMPRRVAGRRGRDRTSAVPPDSGPATSRWWQRIKRAAGVLGE